MKKVEAAVAAAVAALQRPAPLAENEKKNEAFFGKYRNKKSKD
jgi:hypothetical protein